MSDTDKVLEISKALEHFLETNYNAQGKGLHEKVSSVENRLDAQLVKDLRFIATIRNKMVHEYGYNFAADRNRFLEIGNQAVKILKKSNSKSNYSASSPSSHRKQFETSVFKTTFKTTKKNRRQIYIPSFSEIGGFFVLIFIFSHFFNSCANNESKLSVADATLHKAASECDYKLTQIALKEGGNPNSLNDGATTLVEAIDGSQESCNSVVKLLLDNKANVNLMSKSGGKIQSPLHAAAYNANLELIKLLLKRGANPKIESDIYLSFYPSLSKPSMGTPLRWFIVSTKADYALHFESANAFLSSKGNADYYREILSTLASASNINQQDSSGDTSIIESVQFNRYPYEMVKELIKLGANPRLKNKEGKTAYDYAFKKGDTRLIELLSQYR